MTAADRAKAAEVLPCRICDEHGWTACGVDHRAAARPAAGDTRTDRERLREALLTHHPIMRSETGPLSGCRCGQVRLGQDVIAHVVNELHAALSGTP